LCQILAALDVVFLFVSRLEQCRPSYFFVFLNEFLNQLIHAGPTGEEYDDDLEGDIQAVYGGGILQT